MSEIQKTTFEVELKVTPNVFVRLFRSRKFLVALLTIALDVGATYLKLPPSIVIAITTVGTFLIAAIAGEDIAAKAGQTPETEAGKGDGGSSDSKEKPPLSGPPLASLFPFLFAGLLGLSFALSGCRGVKSPQDVAKGLVVEVARGVALADEACAAVVASPVLSDAQARRARDACLAGWRTAVGGLEAAEYAVKAWSAVSLGKISCAAVRSLQGLAEIVVVMREWGLKPSPEVDKALDGAHMLTLLGEGGACGRN